jgi:phosphoribosylpyrophosphate synthetase
LHVVSIAELLAAAIRRLHTGQSLSALFSSEGAPPV